MTAFGMQVGEKVSWKRTFTDEDIRLFAELSGDEGEHHLVPDAHGRLMAHGLFTATLPTKIGGDINFIAQEMTFRFHRPVFSGDTILCEVKILGLERNDQFTRMTVECVCLNQQGKEVMTGTASGIIRAPIEG